MSISATRLSCFAVTACMVGGMALRRLRRLVKCSFAVKSLCFTYRHRLCGELA